MFVPQLYYEFLCDWDHALHLALPFTGMLQVITIALFSFAPLIAMLVPYVPLARAGTLQERQIQWPTLPSNLTEDVLQVAYAISLPCVNNTWCDQLTTLVVRRI